MSSSINSRARIQPDENYEYFGAEEFIKKDSPDGIKLFELWYANHPHMLFKEGDAGGQTVLMYAAANGNVNLVSHLVTKVDKEALNLLSAQGDSILELVPKLAAMYQISAPERQKPVLSKVIQCIQILIDAGADINGCNCYNATPVEALLGTAVFYEDTSKQQTFKEWSISLKYLMQVIKRYIMAGATFREAVNCRVNELLRKANDEIMNLPKVKLLLLAQTEPSTMSPIPRELFQEIMKKIWEQE